MSQHREQMYMALSLAGCALSVASLASVYLRPRRRYAEEVRTHVLHSVDQAIALPAGRQRTLGVFVGCHLWAHVSGRSMRFMLSAALPCTAPHRYLVCWCDCMHACCVRYKLRALGVLSNLLRS